MQEIIQLIIDNQSLLGPAILGLMSSIVTIATFISKATPNETDNKWVGYFSKIVQIFAVHATPTKIIKK